MANDQYSVGFTIKSDFDGKGVVDAKSAITSINGVANNATVATNNLSSSAKGLKSQFTSAAKSAGSLTYLLGEGKGMAGVSKYLGIAIGGLAMGPIGLLIAGITATVTIVSGFIERAEKAKQKLADFRAMVDANRRSIDASGVELLAIKYDNLAKAIDNSAQAQKRLNDANDANSQANANQQIAEVNLREQVQLNDLNPEDTIGRARVSLQAKQERRDIDTNANAKTAENALADKGKAIKAAQDKNSFSNAKLQDVKTSMEDFAERIRKVNEAIADVSQGKGVSSVVDVYANGPNGASYVSGKQTVIDKDAQKAKLAELHKQLKGEKDSPGLEADYKRLSEIYAQTFDQVGAENKEIESLNKELEAAKTNMETANALQLQNNEVKIAENAALAKAALTKDQLSAKEAEHEAKMANLNSAYDAEAMARNKMARAMDIGARQEDERNRIAAMTAGGFIGDRQKDRDKAKEKEKQNDKDKKRADRLKKELDKNGKLGKNNKEWLNLYEEWEKNKNAGGAGGRVQDAAIQELINTQTAIKNLTTETTNIKTEIQNLNKALKSNLTEGGQ